MRKGMLEYCIMLLLRERPYYTSDIIDELENANLIVVEGTSTPCSPACAKRACSIMNGRRAHTAPPVNTTNLQQAVKRFLPPSTKIGTPSPTLWRE